MISVEFKGIRKIPKKFDTIITGIDSVVEDAQEAAMHRLKDEALALLKSRKQNVSRTHGAPQISLFDKESWKFEKVGYTNGSLTHELMNISEHAMAVEVGVHHEIFPKKKGGYLSLGANTYLPYVNGQAGYHYMSDAMTRVEEILNVYRTKVMQYLKSV